MKFRVFMLVILMSCFRVVCLAQDSSLLPLVADTAVVLPVLPPHPIDIQVKDPGALRQDTTRVDKAWGLTEQVPAYRSKKEFNYRSATPQATNLWEQFWHWFWSRWNELMSREGFRVGFKSFLWIASIGILLYAILRVLGMEKVRLWVSGQGRRQGIHGEMVEDIHAIDYATSIEEAEREGRYRDAIRFHFLRSLKLMADTNIIRWHRHKTNIDYTRELATHRLAGPFDQIRRIYEYAWYGEFTVSREDYHALHPYFSGFDKQAGS